MDFFLRVEVRESVDEAGECAANLRAATDEIRELFEDIPGWGALGSDSNTIASVRGFNDVVVALVHGSKNHDNGTSAMLVEVLTRIGEIAPGSYGFVWYLDHEVEYSWRVHTLARGVVMEREDPWFSPMIPTVEDPEPLS